MNFRRRRWLFAGLGLMAALGIVLLAAGASIFRPSRAGVSSAPRAAPTPVVNDAASALLQRGEAAFEQEDYAAAIAAYGDALALNPTFAEAYNDRGLAYFRRGELERAIADYEQALALRPDYVNALTNHAIAIFDRGEYDAVIAETSRAIALDSGNQRAYVFRGNAYQRKGDYGSALSDWLTARTIHAERPGGGL